MPTRSNERWRLSAAAAYLLTLAFVAAAAFLRLVLPDVLEDTPFLAFYPAVVAAAAVGGFGTGMLATLAAGVCVGFLFDSTPGWDHFSDLHLWARLSIFLVGGVGVSLIAHMQRLSRTRERERADALCDSEAEIRRQKDLLAVTLASIGDAVIVTDVQGRVTFLNGEAERLTGWTPQEAAGQPLASVFNIFNEETRQTVESPVDKVLRLGVVVGLANHTALIARHGRETPIDDSGAPIRQSDGTVQGVVMVFRDSSERRAAEQSLRQASAAAEHASKAKDHFLAVLSHELRTPLTPVVTALAMLQSRADFDAPTRESLEMIRRNVELEARLIDDLLDVTRIARGKIDLDRRPIDLGEIIRRTVEVCMPDIEARRLRFGVDAADGPHIVDGDATRLQQVFWNLLRNAIKFTPKDGCVGIRVRRLPGPGSQSPDRSGPGAPPASDNWQIATPAVVVEVTDSGEGIEPAALARIFNAFEQAERSITRQFGGLGLGLTISKAMVEMHGGTIEAHSEGKGKGATFRVKLPVASGLLPEQKDAGSPLGTDTSRLATRPLRILLVEDHGDTAKVMRKLLMLDGHEVEVAADVARAIELAGAEPFDLLLSDLGLPDGSGIELMRELRRRGHAMPAIALSGYGQEQDIQRSREAGFAAHLTKPVAPKRLAETIAAVTR